MTDRTLPFKVTKTQVLNVIPILKWLPSYERSWLKFDIIAGLTLAAVAIPDNIAYATLAGLPPEYGLYAGIMAPLAYFFFATSRHVSIGPSSSEAIMVATFLAAMVISSPAQYAGLVALTAILVGVISLGAWLLRLGFLVNLISGPVMKGFRSQKSWVSPGLLPRLEDRDQLCLAEGTTGRIGHAADHGPGLPLPAVHAGEDDLLLVQATA